MRDQTFTIPFKEILVNHANKGF